VLAQVGVAVHRRLPISTEMHAVWLMEEQPDERWVRTAVFPLGAAQS